MRAITGELLWRLAMPKHLKPKICWPDIFVKQVAATVGASEPTGNVAQGAIDGAGAMTPEQVQLIRSSFAKIAPIKNQAAELFYRRLFALDPSLRPLFKGDMAAQGAKLMVALGAVVASLDQLARVLPAIRQLGRQHRAYSVRPDDYATVGEALIWTLGQGLGADFTKDTRRAWTDAYARVAWAMIAAAEEEEAYSLAA